MLNPLKKLLYVPILSILLFFGILNIGVVNGDTTTSWKNDPIENLKSINEGNDSTALDDTATSGAGGIYGSLVSLKDGLSPYITWAVYIGLSIAFMLIVYNGVMLVTGIVNEGEVDKVKKRMKNIAIGVVIITGFMFIIKIMVYIVGEIFS